MYDQVVKLSMSCKVICGHNHSSMKSMYWIMLSKVSIVMYRAFILSKYNRIEVFKALFEKIVS